MKLFYKQQLHPCILRKVVESWVHSYYSDDVDIKFRAKGNSINFYKIWCVCIAKQLHIYYGSKKNEQVHVFIYIRITWLHVCVSLACVNPTKKFLNDVSKYATYMYLCLFHVHHLHSERTFICDKIQCRKLTFFLYIYSGSWHA